MVIAEPTAEQVDKLFHALADPTRRDIVRRCATGESSVTGLAKTYPMSFAAVHKHVTVLERAGLITKQRRGKEQLVRTETEAVRRATARARRTRSDLARADRADVGRPGRGEWTG